MAVKKQPESEQKPKGWFDSDSVKLLKEVKSTLEGINNNLRQGVATLQEHVNQRNKEVLDRIDKLDIDIGVLGGAIKETLARIEKREGEIFEALVVIMTNQPTSDPEVTAKMQELTKKLDASRASLQGAVDNQSAAT